MAENKEIVKKLSKLVQLDIDAIHAYDQAIKNIDVTSIRDQLIQFKGDHERHVDDLSSSIRQLGGKPPERHRDVKGFFIEGFTAIRSATGTEGALKAMRGNENLTNKTYGDALSWDLPPDIKAVVQRNRDDEQRHLSYIEQSLRDRTWEQRPTI